MKNRKFIKKFMVLVLSACMVTGLLFQTVSASEAGSGSFDEADVTIDDGQELKVVDYGFYNIMKSNIEKVAAGTTTSTTFEFNYAIAYTSQTQLGERVSDTMQALMADCPFELYWYDKSNGCKISYEASDDGSVAQWTIKMYVTEDYQGADSFHTNTTKVAAANKAVSNAKAIVKEAADLDDYSKLEYYRNRICELVSYDKTAAAEKIYGSSWQLINVFDGDPNTNVVCEGYAKAFAYLCDLTKWNSSEIYCKTVTGCYETNSEKNDAHMWNIVHMDNGNNYLVDLTNCDDGTIGYPDGLFMKGYSKIASESTSMSDSQYGTVTQKNYVINVGSENITYYYYSINSKGEKVPSGSLILDYCEGTSLLELSDTDYPTSTEKNGLVRDEDGVYRYYRNGKVDTTYFGFTRYSGGIFLIANGGIITTAQGLVEDPNNIGTYYYLAGGQAQIQYTGLAQYDGAWFYVVKGVLDTTFSGLVDYDGSKFIVAAGQIQNTYNGLWQNSKKIGGDDQWYFFSQGQAQLEYTGLALYDGTWFYVEKGKFDMTKTGYVKYNGGTFYVINGVAQV